MIPLIKDFLYNRGEFQEINYHFRSWIKRTEHNNPYAHVMAVNRFRVVFANDKMSNADLVLQLVLLNAKLHEDHSQFPQSYHLN
jgi:hypothetical protein